MKLWCSITLLSCLLISMSVSAQTIEEIRSVVAKDCQAKASGISSFSCKFAKSEVSIEETCRKEINKNFIARKQLDELAFLYSQITKHDEQKVRISLCEHATIAHQDEEKPDCDSEKSGEKSIERPWWNGSDWVRTQEPLTEIIKKADAGNTFYQVNLGFFFEKGTKCLLKDIASSVKYFCRSNDQGDRMAALQLDSIGKDHGLPPERARDELGRKYGCELTERQIAKKEEEKQFEINFKKNLELAKKGSSAAMYKVATFYLNGEGVAEDYKESFSWAQKGAQKGHPDSMAFLAGMYNRGDGVEKDQEQAFNWTLKAAKAGDRDSKLFLGDLYHNGQGTTINKSEAVKWYLAAHEAGNVDAKSRLKEMADRGELQIEILKRLK